jgi:hypothetical protein
MAAPFPIVHVTWLDACHISPGEWSGLEEVKKTGLAKVETIGMLLHDGKNFVVIGHSFSEGEDVGGGFVIPRGSIVKMRMVKHK